MLASPMPAATRKHRKHPKHRSNRAWIQRHVTDPYVKMATGAGYRSRAAYKLIEIDDRERLLRPGVVVVELGAAPGSWTQVVAERLRGRDGHLRGTIVALDVLEMAPLPGVRFMQGDFREQVIADRLSASLEASAVDVVLSDMAPNLSGIAAVDAAACGLLAELALEFATLRLKPSGALVVKAFHGSGYSQLVEQLKRRFRRVAARKPAASREESAETYLIARGLKEDPSSS
jgi:23S rRNA (uridine2552-2'-O)-methyltransferase